MNINELNWIAGLLEGEGSFIFLNGRRARISCGMTDLDVLEKLQTICGGSICKQRYKRKEYYKDVWVWYLESFKAVELMKDLKPLMGSRRQQKIQDVVDGFEKYREEQKNKKESQILKRDVVFADYQRTGDSLRILASRHGISHVTVKNHIYKARLSRRSDIGDSGTDC